MNRNNEFQELKKELEETPFELDYSISKAISRVKKQKHFDLFWKTPLITLGSVLIIFISAVNLFPKVALAMSEVPLLKYLIIAVSFDPSLRLAVEHDYYQVLGERQTQGDVSATVDYMIVDAGRISLFFHVDAPVKEGIYSFELLNDDGTPFSAGIFYDTGYVAGELESITIEFLEKAVTIPTDFTFHLTVNSDPNFKSSMEVSSDQISPAPSQNSPVSNSTQDTAEFEHSFTFRIHTDQSFRQTVATYPINQYVTISNQKIYLEQLDIYPTKTGLSLSCDKDNEAVVYNLNVYFKDENGKLYKNPTNGVTATLDSEANNINSIYFASSYFSTSKHITMYITGINIIPKEKLYGDIDYEHKTITNLPENIIIDTMRLKDDILTFTLKGYREKASNAYEIIHSRYWDETDQLYSFGSWSTGVNDSSDYFTSTYKIPDFSKHQYRIKWGYAPTIHLDTPIEIQVK
jgi:hypothetical protein